jgi:hypothetical protein
MVEGLQPPNVFGTTGKAFEIMKNVWHEMNVGEVAN